MSTAAPDPADAADDREPGASLRILVVDADDRTRESIVGILGIRHRFDVVGSAGHIGEAVALTRDHRPDVVILDPRLPEVSDGMALIRRMRSIHPDIRICAVGWSPDLEHQALAAGADGFVRKTFKPGDLAGAIARCMDRGIVDAAEAIADANERIAAVKGEPGLVHLDSAPAEASTASPLGPVPSRGTGLIL